MREIQRYVWLLIVLSFVAFAFPLLRDIYHARTYGAIELSAVVKANWEFVSIAIIALQNVASALWLRHEAVKNQVGVLVWATFGLFFGLMAVGIFYLVQINERKET